MEEGRWNRRGRGRLPVEERLCVCGAIQTEMHVASNCPITLDIRNRYNFSNISTIFSNHRNITDQCEIIHLLLSSYN